MNFKKIADTSFNLEPLSINYYFSRRFYHIRDRLFQTSDYKTNEPLVQITVVLTTCQQAKYSSHLCYYISPENKFTFLDIFPSFFKVSVRFAASIALLQIFCNNSNDCKENSSSKIVLDWMELLLTHFRSMFHLRINQVISFYSQNV